MEIQTATTRVGNTFASFKNFKSTTREINYPKNTYWQYFENVCLKIHKLVSDILMKPKVAPSFIQSLNNEPSSAEPETKQSRISLITESNCRNPKIKKTVISSLTDECIEKLNRPTTDHLTAIHYWIWQIYQKHGYHLHDPGGHMMDYVAQQQADDLLNAYLLDEISKLTPYSNLASKLQIHAIKTNLPLSTPFKGKNVDFNKLKI